MKWLNWKCKLTAGKPVKPDLEDYDWTADIRTDEAALHLFQLAQANKMLRVWAEWKAKQN
jgi:hypothetical protein